MWPWSLMAVRDDWPLPSQIAIVWQVLVSPGAKDPWPAELGRRRRRGRRTIRIMPYSQHAAAWRWIAADRFGL